MKTGWKEGEGGEQKGGDRTEGSEKEEEEERNG